VVAVADVAAAVVVAGNRHTLITKSCYRHLRGGYQYDSHNLSQ
jgi:hypothetical protein